MQEKIIWSEKPSKKFILYYSFLHYNSSSGTSFGPIGLTGLILFWIFGFVYLLVDTKVRESAGWSGLITMGILLVLFSIALIIYNIFSRKAYQYTITDQGIRVTYRIFIKKIIEVPFARIIGVNISQNILEKMIGIYDLQIEAEDSTIFFFALDDPNIPRKLILKHLTSKKDIS